MPKLSFSVPHNLGKVEARSRLEALAGQIRDKYQGQVKDVKESWEDDTLCFGFRTMGMNFDGRVAIENERVAVDGSLPFSAMMLKVKIESTIRGELEKLLA